MADILTMQDLANGHLDIKVLGEAANGDENTIVTTRTGNTYPSAERAINIMFKNGGLPATPFATKALMEASALVNGNYAVVTEQFSENGLYYKDKDNWVKSKYDYRAYTDSAVKDIYYHNETSVRWQDYVINGLTSKNESVAGQYLFLQREGVAITKITVKPRQTVTITNAKTDTPWVWFFINETNYVVGRLASSNGTWVVPDGATHLVRNVRYDAASLNENANMSVTLISGLNLSRLSQALSELKDSVLDKEVTKNLNWADAVTAGYTVKTRPDDTGILLKKDDIDVAYTRINVENLESFTVTGSNTDFAGWKWVFGTADNERISMTSSFGNGVFEVPENAVYAFRGVRYIDPLKSANYTESPNMSIVGTVRQKSILLRIKALEEAKNTQLGMSEDLRLLIKAMEKQLASGSTLKLSAFLGATSDAKIRNALQYIKRRGHGILDLETGTHLVDSAVILPSNCWLYLNEATLQLNNGVFDNIIRNEGIVVGNGHGDTATEINENVNIRVIGKNITDSVISGNYKNPYKAPRPYATNTTPVPWVGDDYGWRTLGIYFNNVKHFEIGNFHYKDATCWGVSVEHGCEDFEIHHIDFNTVTKNGDGVDVRMGTKNGHVHNITGRTGDDMVALTAIRNWQTVMPSADNVFFLQVAGFDDIGHGVNITNMRVHDVVGGGNHAGVRLLATGGARIVNVSIDNIADESPTNHFNQTLLRISNETAWGAPSGRNDDISGLSVNNVVANGSGYAVTILQNLANSQINYVRQLASGKGLMSTGTANLTNVQITNVS